MALAHPTGGDACGDQRPATVEVAVHQRLGPLAHLPVDAVAEVGPQLVEPVGPVPPQPVGAVDLGHVVPGRVRRRRGVEGHHLVGDGPQGVGHVVAPLHAPGQSQVLRHPVHDHQVVAERPVGPGDVGHPLVHVGGQAAVEVHLQVAGGQALLPGAEIDEAQVDGLLQLVDPVAHEEQRGGVGLHHRRRWCLGLDRVRHRPQAARPPPAAQHPRQPPRRTGVAEAREVDLSYARSGEPNRPDELAYLRLKGWT